MICISVTPESRKLAKVDLLNAARQCDLVELCLDHLVKLPDIKEMIGGIDKPVLISCRRREDGGHWQDTEETRLALLRQAIVAEPEYIEIELDMAAAVPRFGKTKRVISHTSLDEPLIDVDEIFQRARSADADVVKFTWPTPTLEDAWPLLLAVSRKRELPVVGMGLGRAGLTFSLLARKYGSPWLYAALEKGMEAYDGQPTVNELDEVYGWREIDSHTAFVGMVGFGENEGLMTEAFNRLFRKQGMNARCLPLALGEFSISAKRLETLRINALSAGRECGTDILPLAEHVEEPVEKAQFADFLLKQKDGWHAYNTLWRSALRTIERRLGAAAGEKPLDRKSVMVFGSGPLARSIVYGARRRQGVVSICDSREDAAGELAAQYELRFVPIHQVYDTLTDVVIIADPSLRLGTGRNQLNASYLRPGMTVLDAVGAPRESEAVSEARQRGCQVVEPAEFFGDVIRTRFKSFSGHEADEEALEAVLAEVR